MEGTITKGKYLPDEMKTIVSSTLGHFVAEDRYFIVSTKLGLLIFDIKKG